MNLEYSRAIRTILLAIDCFGNKLVINSYGQLDMRKNLLGGGVQSFGKGLSLLKEGYIGRNRSSASVYSWVKT